MDNSSKRPRKRRKIKIAHVLITLLIVAVAAFAVFRVRVKFKLKARMDAIAAAGYPVTCAELDQWYEIRPDVENAAYTIDEAFSFFEDWDKDRSEPLPVVGKAEMPPRTEPLPPEMKDLMAEYIADHNDALELLHIGAAIKDCRYPVDLSAGLQTQMPNLSEMRKSVFLLKLEAVLHADNGDGASATESTLSCFGIARSLSGLPMTLAQLIRAACQSLAVSTVEQVVNRTQLTDEQLAELAEAVRESERICDISIALVGERCMGISFFRAPETLGFGDGGISAIAQPLLALYKVVGLADSDEVIYLDLMAEYLESAELALHQRQEAAKAVNAKFEATSPARVLLHTIMPAFVRIITLDTRSAAHLRVADAGLAVQRYRLATGKLPDKLADLVPEYLESVPKDPFDGNELRYEKLGPGFVVYSIGEDLSDDGGKEKEPKKRGEKKLPNWDVTFIVER